MLDLCGGSGHLTRVLGDLQPRQDVFLADMFFWKLWLARTFTAPRSVPVCCDANQPLPFARGIFPTVVLSDAFPYIWHKRLLADEMIRLAEPDGTIVMPHLHNSRGENFSAGMTLTPEGYRDLFEEATPHLFSDRVLLAQAVEDAGIDLTRNVSAEDLGSEPSLTLVAGWQATPVPSLPAIRHRARDRRPDRQSPLPHRAARHDDRTDPAIPDPGVRGGVRGLPALPSRHGHVDADLTQTVRPG